jgi:hypothetical protein
MQLYLRGFASLNFTSSSSKKVVMTILLSVAEVEGVEGQPIDPGINLIAVSLVGLI